MIYVSEAAQEYLHKLMMKPENSDKILRLEGIDVHTPYAEAGLRFVDPSPELSYDQMMGFGQIQIFVEGRYLSYLQDTRIDIIKDALGVELIFETPHLKPLPLVENYSLEFKVRYLIDTAINPQLAEHKGRVELTEVREDTILVLKFGGGCQGCRMVDQTTKNLVERILRQHCPEITAVVDHTDHADKTGAFC